MKTLIDFKVELELLFSKYYNSSLGDIVKRGAIYSHVKKRRILFIGINPSYPVGAKPESYSYNVEDAVKLYPRHYKKFQDLANNSNIGNDWTYLDIFYFRETDQKKVLELLNDSTGIDFLCEQLRLTQNIIEELIPEMIIVCNSGVRTFLGIDKTVNKNGVEDNIWLGYQFQFDELLGIDIITNINPKSIGCKTTNLKGVPVLFTSALTYMEKSTRSRIEWHMRHVLRMKKEKDGANIVAS